MSRHTLLIIDNDMNTIMKTEPITLEIGEPHTEYKCLDDGLCVNKVEQNIKIIYDECKFFRDAEDYFAESKGHCKYIEGSLIGIDDGLYKPACLKMHNDDDFFNWNQIRHFKFCPYCGRKIEVVEE